MGSPEIDQSLMPRRSSSREISRDGPTGMKPLLKKVRTGCTTCKERKVKCGEEKPFCLRCISTGRNCPGYSSPPPFKVGVRPSKYDVVHITEVAKRSPQTNVTFDTALACAASALGPSMLSPQVSLSPDPTESFSERQCLHYLHTRASKHISTYFEGDFWYYSLQASQSEPSIHHAILAISSLYEAHELSHLSAIQASRERLKFLKTFALQQYTKAVNLLSGCIGGTTTTPQVVLISCLIFIWLEFLQDNVDIALGHLRSGVRILSQQPRASLKGDNEGCLIRIFARLHTQAVLHGSPTFDFNPEENRVISSHEMTNLSPFSTIQDARASLDECLNRTFRFHRMIERPGFVQKRQLEFPHPHTLSLEAMCQIHLNTLQVWKTLFDTFQHDCSNEVGEQDIFIAAELELQYLVTTNTLATLFATSPMVYDVFHSDFTRMLQLSKHLIRNRTRKYLLALPLDAGVLAPLFYVLLKCRDSSIRREAMELLHECPKREGIWDRNSIIELSRWKITKEEQGRAWLGVPELEPVPEQARIFCEKPRAGIVDGRAVTVVSYKRGPYGGIADIEPDEEEVTNLSMRLAAVVGT